ncbi:MAG: HAD-IA family hydrolase [Oscillospiraceae bacterium]|nr:HAD-IA family hydrolase [Oscillospiraceae bacterium]
MQYDAILFDMDGTVLNTLDDLRGAVNAAMSAFGRPALTPEQVRRYVGNGSRRLLELALGDGADEALIERVLAWYKPYYDAHCRILTRPYEGVPELLAHLRARGKKLAVVSNKPDSAVKTLAADFFPGLLELAVGENESAGIRRKPWPDMLDAAREALGASRERCLYVGDSEVDLATAANAGLACASVSWGFRTPEELRAAGAGTLFPTPEALEAYLLSDG